jgi:hypothetical protein
MAGVHAASLPTPVTRFFAASAYSEHAHIFSNTHRRNKAAAYARSNAAASTKPYGYVD